MYCNFLKAVDQERVMVLLSLNTFVFQVLVKITWLYLYQCHLNWKCEMQASLQSPDQKKCISKWKRKGFLYFIQYVFLSIPFFFSQLVSFAYCSGRDTMPRKYFYRHAHKIKKGNGRKEYHFKAFNFSPQEIHFFKTSSFDGLA